MFTGKMRLFLVDPGFPVSVSSTAMAARRDGILIPLSTCDIPPRLTR
jgi:hypothetical protein